MKASVFALALTVLLLCPAQAKDGGPAGLGEFLKETESQIDGMVSEWGRLPKTPIQFSANLTLAYGGTIGSVPEEALLEVATALKEAGVARIDINPNEYSLSTPEAVSKYEALFKHIHQLGLKVAINPEYTATRTPKMSFKEYEAASIKDDAEWASRFQPDVFVVVHEPTTMAARMGVDTTPQEWRR